MKKASLLMLLFVVAACSSNNILDSVKTAEDFKEMLISKLGDSVASDSLAAGKSWGEVYSSTFHIPITDSNYDHSATFKTCLEVLSDWKEKYDLHNIPAGGGSNYFSLNYQVNSVHIFIDVISYKLQNGKNIILLLIRAS